MGELTTIIRIGLYVLAGYLIDRGLPPEAADLLTSDPAVAEAVANIMAAVVAGAAVLWWRLAKRFGWAT